MAKKTEMTENPIIFVSGDKGGVGKSMVAITLVEYLRNNGTPVAVVDTDMTNPDVHDIYAKSIKSAHVNLEAKDGGGWMQLVEFAESNPETIVVSMKAGSKTSTEENQKFINDAFKMLRRPVVLFFVLGLQKQCSILFYDSLGLFPALHAAIAVKNLKNGDIDEFFNWDEAKQNEAFKGVKEIIFPKVHARISLKITDDDMMISELLDGGALRISERAALQAWLDSVFAAYDGVKDSIGV